jgi:hypothetical protein
MQRILPPPAGTPNDLKIEMQQFQVNEVALRFFSSDCQSGFARVKKLVMMKCRGHFKFTQKLLKKERANASRLS